MPGISGLGDWFKKRLDEVGADVNIFDGGRSHGNMNVAPAPSVGHQLTHNPVTDFAGNMFQEGIVAPIQRSGNTVAAGAVNVMGLGNVGYQSIFGSDKSYQNALDETAGASNDLLQHGWGNKGAYLTPQQAQSSGGGWQGARENFVKPVTRGVAEVAPLVVPIARPAAGASLGIKVASSAAQNAAVGAGSSAGMQYAANGHVDLKQTAKDAAVAGAIGAAFPVAGAGTKTVGKGVKVAADKTGDAIAPRYNGLRDNQIIMNPKMLDVLHNAKQDLATNHANIPLAQSVINGLHEIKKTYGHDFINGPTADRMQRINQFLEQNGEAIPQFQESIMKNMDRQAVTDAAQQSGQAGYIRLPGGGKFGSVDEMRFAREKYADKWADATTPNQRQFLEKKINQLDAEIAKHEAGGNLEQIAQADPNSRPQGAEQTAFENAHNSGNKAAEAQAGAQLTDPALRGEMLSPEAKAAMLDKFRAQAAGSQPKGVTIRKATRDSGPIEGPAANQAPDGTPLTPAAKSSFVDPEINTSKYKLPKKSQKELDVIAQELRPDIEAKVGKTLSLDEIKGAADATGNVLTNAKNRDATLKYSAALLNAREQLAALTKKRTAGTITPEETVLLNKTYAQVKMAAADAGRTLNAFKEVATPQERQVIDVMIDRIQQTGAKLDDIQAALGKIDSTDPKQLAAFYRDFVKATKDDWLDKFRYTNMLSSPLTHIVNVTSNAQGVLGVAPVQKLYEGGVDAARAAITGGERTRFAGEAGSYIAGSVKALPEAWNKAMAVIKGEELMTNPDMNALQNVPLATSGPAAVADKILSVIPTFLEASDQFGMTVARAGEKAGLEHRAAKGVKVDLSPENVHNVADEAAKYRVFRQELGANGQGHLLEMIDQIPQAVSKMRKSENPYVRNIAKFTFPFVNTPTNIFKQGIEYSPAGILTLHGSADKTAQAAKMLMGTTAVSMVGGVLAAGGDLTFAEPTNPDERNAFRAEGKQPYALRIPGTDKWIGYSKLHPAIAFNLATVAAVKDGLDKGSIDQSTADKIMGAASGIMGYFRDQSYMKSVGDLTSIMQSKDGAKFGDVIANQAGNTLNQLAPFKSLTSWIGRQVDPTQRKIDYDASTPQQIYQNLVKDIPGLNGAVPARENPYTGEPLKNDHPILNSYSPLRVTDDRGFGNTTGLNIEQRQITRDLEPGQREEFRRGVIEVKALNKDVNQQKQLIKDGKDPSGVRVSASGGKGVTVGNSQIKPLADGSYYTKVGGEFKTFKTVDQAKQAVFVDGFKSGDKKMQEYGGKIYIKNDSEQGYSSMSKDQFEFNKLDSQLTLELDRAKGADDVGRWFKAAETKYNALEKLRKSYDPETEADKIADVTLKMENLRESAEKYQEYGGFKKGSKGNSGLPSINVAVSSDLSGPVVNNASYKAPSLTLQSKRGVRVARGKSTVKLGAAKKI